jgi:hypothetical protein
MSKGMSMETYQASFRLATEQDTHLETYDHTKLSAINTCPTWGVLRYTMHKRMPSTGRALALEAGHAMHECFAFIRLVSLIDQHTNMGDKFQEQLWYYHGTRLFGEERLQHIDSVIQEAGDVVEVAKRGSIAVLDTSGYYDDPRDRRRTLSNMEEAIYAYINRWRWDHLVWMRNSTDPTSDIGIEIPFDLVVDISGSADMQLRLTGRIDGIHYNGRNELTIHDNKTASRLNDAWQQSFLLSHQITGYCVAASTFAQHPVHNAEVLGLALPLPKTYDFGGYIRETVSRRDYHYTRWLQWLVHTITMARQYKDNPYDAPKYTHSCNRYFRPCAFIPFCDADDEEQHTIVQEMETDEWSPLEGRAVIDGIGNE